MSHAGLVWLGEVSDRSGLTAGLSEALADAPRRRHDPGVTLAQMVLALTDGADCSSELEALRGQPRLFGPVPSRSSAQRAFEALGPAELRRLAGARRDARAAAWEAGAFSLGYWIDSRVREALLLAQEEDWEPARNASGRVRDGAQVVEITHLVNLDAWPPDTRLIVRCERPHPGADVSLFDTLEGLRHTAFITNTPGDDLAAVDPRHRRRGRAEQTLRADVVAVEGSDHEREELPHRTTSWCELSMHHLVGATASSRHD